MSDSPLGPVTEDSLTQIEQRHELMKAAVERVNEDLLKIAEATGANITQERLNAVAGNIVDILGQTEMFLEGVDRNNLNNIIPDGLLIAKMKIGVAFNDWLSDIGAISSETLGVELEWPELLPLANPEFVASPKDLEVLGRTAALSNDGKGKTS